MPNITSEHASFYLLNELKTFREHNLFLGHINCDVSCRKFLLRNLVSILQLPNISRLKTQATFLSSGYCRFLHAFATPKPDDQPRELKPVKSMKKNAF